MEGTSLCDSEQGTVFLSLSLLFCIMRINNLFPPKVTVRPGDSVLKALPRMCGLLEVGMRFSESSELIQKFWSCWTLCFGRMSLGNSVPEIVSDKFRKWTVGFGFMSGLCWVDYHQVPTFCVPCSHVDVTQPSHFQEGYVAAVSHAYPAGSHIPGTHLRAGQVQSPWYRWTTSHPCNPQCRSVSRLFLSLTEIVSMKWLSINLDIQ